MTECIRRCNSPPPVSPGSVTNSYCNEPSGNKMEEKRCTRFNPIHSTPCIPRSNSDSAIEISGIFNLTGSDSILKGSPCSTTESGHRSTASEDEERPSNGEEARSSEEATPQSEEEVIPSAPSKRTAKQTSREQSPALRFGEDPSGEKEVPPITRLMQRTGYPIVQQNGQRRYGPPPNWKESVPPRGCEVFVGKIPRDCFEDELVPVLEQAGTIYEMRLMVDFSGFNRGYAFVVYGSQSDARNCVRLFNNYEIRKGRLLGVCMSIDNCRLFIGGIPKRVVKEDILDEINKVCDVWGRLIPLFFKMQCTLIMSCYLTAACMA